MSNQPAEFILIPDSVPYEGYIRYSLKWRWDKSKKNEMSYTLAEGSRILSFKERKKVQNFPLHMDINLYKLLTRERGQRIEGIIDPIGWEGGWVYDIDEGDEFDDVKKAYYKTSENFKSQFVNMINMAKEGFFCLEVSGYASPIYDGLEKNDNTRARNYNIQLSKKRLMACISFLKREFNISENNLLYGEYSTINREAKIPNFNVNQSVWIRTVSR